MKKCLLGGSAGVAGGGELPGVGAGPLAGRQGGQRGLHAGIDHGSFKMDQVEGSEGFMNHDGIDQGLQEGPSRGP